MTERQPPTNHKLQSLASFRIFLLLGCLSFIILPAYADNSTNPITNPTIAGIIVPKIVSTQNAYCQDGVCHTGTAKLSVLTPITNPITFKLPSVDQNLIGIQLSKTCINLEKNNLTSSCLTYFDLLPLDNTNQHLAGYFVYLPYFHRLAPTIPNFFMFANSNNTVMIDPSAEFTSHARLIIVNEKNFTWINKSEEGLNGGTIARYHFDRYMQGCDLAQVAANYTLVKETLSYMESGCSNTTFNDTKTITQKEIPFEMNNQYSTLHQEDYLASIFHNHKFMNSYKPTGGLGPSDCVIHKCNFTDPYAKVGYKW